MTTKGPYEEDPRKHAPDKNYDPDPRWQAVDDYTLERLHPSSRPNNAALTSALTESKKAGLPPISAGPVQAKFLSMMCTVGAVEHALEVGTLGGYTAVWLLTQNPGLRLTTIEFDAHNVEVARANIQAAGVADRCEVIQGDGMEVLPRLKEGIQAGKRDKFGLVFIDADKKNAPNYFDLAVDMCRSRALIAVDNMVFWGTLVDMNLTMDSVKGNRETVERAGKNSKVEAVVVQTVEGHMYDACLWAVVK